MNEALVPDFKTSTKHKREYLTTGVLPLDAILGGGLPLGGLVEIFGAESSAKTALAFNIIKEAQKKQRTCVFLDLEHKFNKDYAKKVGINLSKLMLSNPLTGEEGYRLLEELIKIDKVSLIVVDSFSCFNPEFMYHNLKRLSAQAHQHRTTILFLNQVRYDIPSRTEVTPGGHNLQYHMDLRLKLVNAGTLREDLKVIGNHFKAEVVKNQYSYQLEQSAEFDVFLEQGVSWESGLLELAISKNLVKMKGSWYIILSERVARGKLATIRYLMKNKEKCLELLQQLNQL